MTNTTQRKFVRLADLIGEITDDLQEYRSLNGRRSPNAQSWWSLEKEKLAARYGERNVWLSRRRARWQPPNSNVIWMGLTISLFSLQLLTWLFV